MPSVFRHMDFYLVHDFALEVYVILSWQNSVQLSKYDQHLKWSYHMELYGLICVPTFHQLFPNTVSRM